MTKNDFDDFDRTERLEDNTLNQSENLIQHNKRAAEVEEKLDAQHERSRGVIDGMTGTFHRIETDKVRNETTEKTPWYKKPFIRKIGFALVSLIVALTLWGYVLMKENPTRIKSVENVKLNFEVGAEADLKSRGLIVNDDINALLTDVTVNVRTTLNDLPRFNNSMADVVTATINLSDIREPGTYERNIIATSTIGTVESVDPKTITITVESLRSNSIPVSFEFIGELPDGYWHDDPQLSQTSINVTGPESVINKVRSGVCQIDLSKLKSRLYASMPIKLIDADNNAVDMSNIVDTVPSVIVTMNVYPTRSLSPEEFLILVGKNEDLYEYEITSSPDEIIIAAPEAIIDSISGLVFKSIDVSDLKNGEYMKYTLELDDLPEGAIITNLVGNQFTVTVEVSDKIVSRTFDYIISDILTENGQNTWQYNVSGPNPYLVTFNGPARYLNDLAVEMIQLYVDVSGLTEAKDYAVLPIIRVEGDPAWLYDDSVTTEFGQVTVRVIHNSTI